MEESDNLQEQQQQQELASSSISEDKMVYMNEEGEIVVDEEHPEIRAQVERALDELTNFVVTLPPADYVSTLRDELDALRKQRFRIDPLAPMFVNPSLFSLFFLYLSFTFYLFKWWWMGVGQLSDKQRPVEGASRC